jgi:hypothetical protein
MIRADFYHIRIRRHRVVGGHVHHNHNSTVHHHNYRDHSVDVSVTIGHRNRCAVMMVHLKLIVVDVVFVHRTVDEVEWW